MVRRRAHGEPHQRQRRRQIEEPAEIKDHEGAQPERLHGKPCERRRQVRQGRVLAGKSHHLLPCQLERRLGSDAQLFASDLPLRRLLRHHEHEVQRAERDRADVRLPAKLRHQLPARDDQSAHEVKCLVRHLEGRDENGISDAQYGRQRHRRPLHRCGHARRVQCARLPMIV